MSQLTLVLRQEDAKDELGIEDDDKFVEDAAEDTSVDDIVKDGRKDEFV